MTEKAYQRATEIRKKLFELERSLKIASETDYIKVISPGDEVLAIGSFDPESLQCMKDALIAHIRGKQIPLQKELDSL